jgi:prolyl 4-hydroxylase
MNMAGWLSKTAGVAIGTAIVSLSVPYVRQQIPPLPAVGLASFQALFTPREVPGQVTAFQCLDQNYTTHLVSIDPLVIYIRNFINEVDITGLLAAGEPLFQPSFVTKNGRTQGTPDRTSWSAGLPREDEAVRCVLGRAEAFMGTMMAPGRDEMGPPQLVRYTSGQRFNIHHDWFGRFQPARDGRNAEWNRVASFFVILQDNCTEGETYFPHIKPISPQDKADTEKALWRDHEDGGLAFRPVAGNALFWLNLHQNLTGDRRVMHAGLPVKSGLKTAMNIWPRQYIGPEAWDWPSP